AVFSRAAIPVYGGTARHAGREGIGPAPALLHVTALLVSRTPDQRSVCAPTVAGKSAPDPRMRIKARRVSRAIPRQQLVKSRSPRAMRKFPEIGRVRLLTLLSLKGSYFFRRKISLCWQWVPPWYANSSTLNPCRAKIEKRTSLS